MRPDRPYDLVLFGATGFTGGLTAEYLARHAPAGLRWALAGRNPAKLSAVRDRLAAIDPALATLPLLTADVTDAGSLRPVVTGTRVLATTVGPYVHHGEPLVAACAAAGTDYLDITGEPEFVDLMYVRHHAEAVRTGARLVHACGFDSVPHDLGVWYTVRQLPTDGPVSVDGFVRAGGGSPPGRTIRRSPRSPVPRRRSGRRGPDGRSSPGRTDAGSVRWPGSWVGRRRSACGRCRCPPSTRRWYAGPPPPARSTARTSVTGTSPPSGGCRRCCWPGWGWPDWSGW